MGFPGKWKKSHLHQCHRVLVKLTYERTPLASARGPPRGGGAGGAGAMHRGPGLEALRGHLTSRESRETDKETLAHARAGPVWIKRLITCRATRKGATQKKKPLQPKGKLPGVPLPTFKTGSRPKMMGHGPMFKRVIWRVQVCWRLQNSLELDL